jgi:hypothetical protein
MFVALGLGLATSGYARAQYRDSAGLQAGEKPETKDPLRGSIFIFDQSITTPTIHVGLETPQSYVPFYGWWLSLRPRWWFTDELRVQARLDFMKEFTNSENTTYRDEDVFADLWTDLTYQRLVAKAGGWKNTKVTLGLRAKWPTSKESQANGIYVTAGATAGVSQKIPIHGDSAPVLDSARIGLSLSYWHPFSSATTPNAYNSFGYLRQDLDERLFESNQISGQMLANHTLWVALEAGLQITPKLDLALFSITVNQWHYNPTNAAVLTTTGSVPVSHANDQQFTQLEWFLFVADYELVDELSLGIGYYNLQNTLASDGTPRTIFGGGEDNLLWGPDAHIFVDVTANLDKLFEDASGKYKSAPGQTSAAARAARTQRIAGEVR